MGDLVYAVTTWPTNAELIADVARLGYIKQTDRVLDPTFCNGIWWKKFKPDNLVTYHREKDGSDFRLLGNEEDESFDVIAYDPPYVAPGGIKTSTIPEFHKRFGMAEGGAEDRMFSSPAELQDLIDDGLTEMTRLVRKKGFVLVKGMNYVSSGRVWWGVDKIKRHAENLRLNLVDEFIHQGGGRPQEKGRTRKDGSPSTQQHARRNHSNLLVLQKPWNWTPPDPEAGLA